MSGMSATGSSNAPIDTPLSPPVIVANDPHPVAPTLKRKPGRPCNGESSRGKAPMAASSAPKRARGYFRKDQPFMSQYETSPRMVTYNQFYAGHMDHHHQLMAQSARIDILVMELRKAKETIDRQERVIDLMCRKLKATDEHVKSHQEILEDVHDIDVRNVNRFEKLEGTSKKVVECLVEYLDFTPPAPPA